MFDKLENRYLINGTLLFDTPFHIGSGEAGTETDSLVVKYHSSEPYIPGSSFKGVLRSTVERIARSLDIDTCILYSSDECNRVIMDEINGDDKKKKMREGLPRTETDYIDFLLNKARGARGLCRTCRLFGSTFIASKLYVDDLKLDGVSNMSCEIRDGVGIDRDTGTAVEGVKYDYEVVPQGQGFKLHMRLENADENDLLLLAIGLREFMDGIKLGGMTSRGLGSCKMVDGMVTNLKIEDKKMFLKYLATGEIDPSANIRLGEFVREQIEKGMKEIPC